MVVLRVSVMITRLALRISKNKLSRWHSQDLDLAYVSVPKISLKHVVIPATEIHDYAEGVWKDYYDRLANEDVVHWYKGVHM